MAEKKKKESIAALAQRLIQEKYEFEEKQLDVIAQIQPKGKGLSNCFAAVNREGMTIYQLDNKHISPLNSYNWSDWSSASVDKYAIKSVITFNDGQEFSLLDNNQADFLSFVSTQTSIDIETKKRPLWNKILGYRSKNKAKMTIASIFYGFMLLAFASAVFGPEAEEVAEGGENLNEANNEQENDEENENEDNLDENNNENANDEIDANSEPNSDEQAEENNEDNNENDSANNENDTANNDSNNEEIEEEPQDIQSYVNEMLDDHSGLARAHEDYPEKIMEVEERELIDDQLALELHLAVRPGWSASSTLDGALYDSLDYFEAIFNDHPEYDRVELYWMTDFTDQYGNDTLSEMLNIDLTQETAEKINFDNFNIDNFPQVADYYQLHPSFNE